MKAVAGSRWGFDQNNISVATYKGILCACATSSILTLPYCFIEVSSNHLDKLEVIQKKALWIAIGCFLPCKRLRCPTSEPRLGLFLEDTPGTVLEAVLLQRPPTPVTSSSQTPSPYPALIDSEPPSRPPTNHLLFRGRRINGDDPNAPLSSSRAFWERVSINEGCAVCRPAPTSG